MDVFNSTKLKKIKFHEIGLQKLVEIFPWGHVYQGTTKGGSKKPVTIKRYIKEVAIKTKKVDLIQREIKFLSYMNNPYIVNNINY